MNTSDNDNAVIVNDISSLFCVSAVATSWQGVYC